jgi:hypothetical protein
LLLGEGMDMVLCSQGVNGGARRFGRGCL